MSLIRNLNEYSWEMSGKKIVLTNKKLGVSFELDKVRLMSFMKFAPNCLDKMRIEEGKQLRISLKMVKAKNALEREKSRKKTKLLNEKVKSLKGIKRPSLFKNETKSVKVIDNSSTSEGKGDA